MASGSFGVSTSNGYIKGTVSWSSTEVVADNYSNVSVSMRLSRTNSGYTTWGTGTFNVVVNGTTVSSGSKDFTLTYNSNTLMVSGTVKVNHNTDGKKSITISWSGSSNVFNVTSGSGTAVLDTIPRASTLSSNADWTAGSNKAISISRASSSFHHTVIMYVNGVEVKRAENIGSSVTMAFNTAENTKVFQQLAQKATESTTIRVYTYDSADNYIGTYTYKNGTVTAPSASYTTITNPTNVSSYSGQGGQTVYIDQSVSVSVTRYNSDFTHTIRFKNGNSGSIIHEKTGVTTSYTWTPTTAEQTALYNSTPNSIETDGQIDIITYYNGVQVRGVVDRDINFRVRNSDPTFTGDFTYKDSNSTTTGVTGNNQYIIQGKSNVVVEIPTTAKATANNSATMVKYEATLNGTTKTATYSSTATVTIDFGTISAPGNQTLTVRAVDSRGNYTSKTKTLTMVPYSPPVINATAKRQNNFEATTTLTMKGSISAITVVTTQKNSVTASSVEYRYKDASVTTWSSWTDFAFTTSTTSYTATNKTLTLDNTKSFDVEFRVSDRLSTTTTAIRVDSGQPIFFIDSTTRAVGINKFPTGVVGSGGRPFEVKGGALFDGGYLELATYSDSYGAGMMQSYFDATTSPPTWRVYGKDSSYATIPINLSLGANGTIEANNIYLSSTADASGTSTDNALTIGARTGGNLKLDFNEISAFNGSGTSTLYLNPDGGPVLINSTNRYDNSVGLEMYNKLLVRGNGDGVSFYGNDHFYLEFYSKGTTSRTAWFGFGSSGNDAFQIANGIGRVNIQTNDGGYAEFMGLGSHDGLRMAGTAIVKWLSSSQTVQIRNSSDGAYGAIQASSFDPSDITLKENITDFDELVLEKIRRVDIKRFDYIDGIKNNIGIIAQELQPIFPELIMDVDSGEEDNYLSVSTYGMVSVLWKAVQELTEHVKFLDAKLKRR